MRTFNLSMLCMAGLAFGAPTFAANETSTATLTSKQQMQADMKASHSKQLQQDKVAKEKSEVEQTNQPIAEAISSIESTRAAIRLLDVGDTNKATAELEKSAGKLDIVLAQHPNLNFVPIAVNVRMMDLVTDDAAVKAITKQVKSLVNNGEYQKARQVLRGFASEINITSTSVPMGTYPAAIKDAARLIKEGHPADARAELAMAMNSVVIAERSIPLPVVRAEAMMDEVSRQVTDKKVNAAEANELLSMAQDQLKMAENMGYGNGKRDFASLQASLKQLKSDVGKNKENKGILSKIMDDLRSLKR